MKNTIIKVRCTEEDKETYNKIAKLNGLDLSSYVRFLLNKEILKARKENENI